MKQLSQAALSGEVGTPALKGLRARVQFQQVLGASAATGITSRVTVWSLAPLPHILCRCHASSENHLLLGCRFPSNCMALCECEAETYLILGNRENHRPLRELICIFVTARELHEQVELSYRFKLHIVSSVKLFSDWRMPVLKRG